MLSTPRLLFAPARLRQRFHDTAARSARVAEEAVGADGRLQLRLEGAEVGRKATRRPLLVLNVQPAISPSRFVSKAMIAEHQRRSADEALAPARALLKRLGTNARTYTAIGDPAATIIAFANKHRCSAIVMGSRGQGGIAGIMLGSVASKVIQLAKRPVTIIK